MSKVNKNGFGYLGLDYQIRLIAQILTDEKWANTILDIIDANYFEDETLRLIVSEIRDAYDTDEVVIDIKSLEFRLLNRISNEFTVGFIKTQLDSIKKASLKDSKKIQKIAMTFCKQQELKKSIRKIDKIIERGDLDEYDECEEILKKALDIGDNKDDAIDVLHNLKDVLSEDFRKPIPTGIHGLDAAMDGGLSKTELAVILAPFGVGKAQPNYSKVLTLNGWVKMGDIKINDLVISQDGNPTKVTGVFPQGVRPIMEVTFNDKSKTRCDKEHLWSVKTNNDNTFKNIKTEDIDLTKFEYQIPTTKVVNFDNTYELKLTPNLIGDIINNSEFIEHDLKNIQTYEEVNGELVIVKTTIKEIKKHLKEYGLLDIKEDEKFIPKDYLTSSIRDRITLLSTLTKSKQLHNTIYRTTSKQLANDVKELVWSLGGTIKTNIDNGTYVIEINSHYKNRRIESIKYIGDEEATCIMVDNPSHLYLTDDYIVTHNTTMITKIANTAKNLGKNVLQIFFEDNPKVIQRKHLTCWAKGKYTLNELTENKEELMEIAKKIGEEKGVLKLKKFPSDGTTIQVIKQYIRKLIAQGFKPDIVLIDYIDCISPSKKVDDVNVGEGKVMREFESMLSELDIAGWTAIQGNRSSIGADTVDSTMIGGSIKKGQIGHFICSIAKTLEQKENGTANMAILKSRFGRDGLVFEDIIFDNARIQIDVTKQTQRTFLETKEVKLEKNQNRVNFVLDALKSTKN